MCKFKFHILVFLCISGALTGILRAEPSIVLKTSADALCTANPFIQFIIDFEDDGSFGTSNLYILEFSEDGVNWSQIYRTNSLYWGYTQRPTNLQEGWYRYSVARLDEVDQLDKWISSEPVYMEKIEGGCTPFRFTWPDEVSENVCPRGTILFREDFGGNDPSDPITSKERLTTMSSRYIQSFDVISRVYSGKFVVAKHGWQNNLNTSTTETQYSQWFIQDDHTYPNDYTRGYLLEVDGIGGNDAFYMTRFDVCHEMDLSFSAYVANVLEPGHNFARPKVRFLIQDERTMDTIWEQSSGKIEPAPADYSQHGLPTTMSAPWHLVGASFHVPAGVDVIRLSIFNDESSGSGNDFAMDDIEIRLCKPEVSILSGHEVCLDSSYVFEANVTADGGFQQPYNYLWQYATDSLEFNSDGWTNVVLGETLSFDSIKPENEGWYRLCVTSAGVNVVNKRACRAMSEPFHLTTKMCCPKRVDEFEEITVCDTLMPYRWHDTIFYKDTTYEIIYKNENDCEVKRGVYTLHTKLCCPDVQYAPMDTIVCDTLIPFTWRGMVFDRPSTQEVMEKSPRGCDSILHIYTLNTKLCCPDVQIAPIDTTVCDTLMPFTWRGMVFDRPSTQEVMEISPRGCDSILHIYTLNTELCCRDVQYAPMDTIVCDTLLPFIWNGLVFDDPSVLEVMEISPRGCDSILHIYTLDTVHCERLYPIIVNKYNWQLLCDNTMLYRLFPEQTATAFQWFKNDEPVWGATEDDYAEQNELHGRFQLRVMLTGDQTIWSNILEILDEIEENPVQVHIFDSRGEEVTEDQISHGIYLYRFEQGNSIWTEKRLIP